MSCEVCNRERDTEVFASTLGPFSSAICRECWKEAAEPEWAFAVTLEETGGDVGDWVRQCVTWSGGAYRTWDEWRAASGMSAFGQDAEERLEAKPASPTAATSGGDARKEQP